VLHLEDAEELVIDLQGEPGADLSCGDHRPAILCNRLYSRNGSLLQGNLDSLDFLENC
jgi:hypothetical protein